MSTDQPAGDQRRLDEFLTNTADADTDLLVNGDRRCQAMSVRYSRQCRHEALPGTQYCAHHYHRFDE